MPALHVPGLLLELEVNREAESRGGPGGGNEAEEKVKNKQGKEM